MKDNWLKDLQGKLADYEREAPDMLWENIEKQLQSPRHKRNTRMDMEKICGSCHSFTSHMFLIFFNKSNGY